MCMDYFALPERTYENLNFPDHLSQMTYCWEKSSNLSKHVWANYTSFSVYVAKFFWQDFFFTNSSWNWKIIHTHFKISDTFKTRFWPSTANDIPVFKFWLVCCPVIGWNLKVVQKVEILSYLRTVVHQYYKKNLDGLGLRLRERLYNKNPIVNRP